MRIRLGQPLRRPALAVVPIIVIGLAGTAIALSDRSADSVLLYRQQNLSAVEPSAVAHLVSLTSDPRPSFGHTRAEHATCSTQATGELRNPWSCLVHYGHGPSVHYLVRISPTGSIAGTDPTGLLVIHGCCVGPHQAQR